MKRAESVGLDELLGQKIKVLDDGFVCPIDYLGNDQTVVRSARVSYGDGTKTVREDRGLIRYLMRHRHTSPFEMCQLMVYVRVPMDTWRQWIRHRTARVNEYSTRYSVAIREMSETGRAAWRVQSDVNKQGSDGLLDESVGQILSSDEKDLHAFARDVYQHRLDVGVAREQARKDLPLSTYTEAYWSIDLHNLFHFLGLREDTHAQLEIRQYANALHEIVRAWVPLSLEAFEDYTQNSVTFSGPEIEFIRKYYSIQPLQYPATTFGKAEFAEFYDAMLRLMDDKHDIR